MKLNLFRAMAGLFCVATFVACVDKPTPDGDLPPTPEPTETTGDLKLAVKNVVFDGAEFTTTPSDPKKSYFFSYIEKSVFDKIGNDATFVKTELSVMAARAAQSESTLEQYISEMGLLSAGAIDGKLEEVLDAQAQYYLYVYGLDGKGVQTSPLEKLLIQTPVAPPVVMSDITFEFSLSIIESNSFGFVMYPSNYDTYVYCDYIPKKKYIEIGGSPQALREWIISVFTTTAEQNDMTVGRVSRANCRKGMQAMGMTQGVAPGSEYVSFALAFDSQGRETSEVEIFEFATTEMNYSKASIEFFDIKWYDGDALATEDVVKYGKYDGKAYMLGSIRPNADAKTWGASAMKAATAAQFDDVTLIMGVEQNGLKNSARILYGATWGEITLLGLGYDAEGLHGQLLRHNVNITRDGVSPIEDIITPKSSIAQSMIEMFSFDVSRYAKRSDVAIVYRPHTELIVPSSFNVK